MNNQLYSILAGKVGAYHRCEQTGNTDWKEKHKVAIRDLVKEYAPRGSGFDEGTGIHLDLSTSEKLVFETSFHHLNDSGMYDGWTTHTITVTPSLAHDFNIRVSGRNRNDIKEYIHGVFSEFLSTVETPTLATV